MKTISLTIISIVLLGFLFALRDKASELHDEVLADFGSEIQVVVCSATSARTSSLRNSELVSNIVNGLPKDVHVLLLVNDRQAFDAKDGGSRVSFVELPSETGISIWPQDPFVVVSNQQETRLITPCTFEREDDRIMPIALGKALDIEVISSDLYFEGGNIVTGEDAVFIGVDTIAMNAQLHQEERAEIKSRFEKLLGRPVVVVGQAEQTINHIDLIVTPLSGNRVAIADSRLGANLARQSMQNAPEEVSGFEKQCENMFFGREDITELSDLSGDSILRPVIVGQTANAIRSSLAVADELDAIANQLSQAGYSVVRIPALVPDLSLHLNEAGKEKPNYPFVTYNNVLVENKNGRPVVYLPQYGFPVLDAAGAQGWKRLGFDVKRIAGFSTSAMYGGSLRCCTKVLLRRDDRQ